MIPLPVSSGVACSKRQLKAKAKRADPVIMSVHALLANQHTVSASDI